MRTQKTSIFIFLWWNKHTHYKKALTSEYQLLTNQITPFSLRGRSKWNGENAWCGPFHVPTYQESMMEFTFLWKIWRNGNNCFLFPAKVNAHVRYIFISLCLSFLHLLVALSNVYAKQKYLMSTATENFNYWFICHFIVPILNFYYYM